jgi:hypothetical protein
MLDHLASIHSNLSTIDHNNRSHVTTILKRIDITRNEMKNLCVPNHSVPKAALETKKRIVDSLTKLNELGLVNIKTNERINSSLIKNNDLGLINNNKVSSLNNKITEIEININNKIQNNEKTINNKLKDMEENINNNIDQMTAIIQQDIIVENQV